MATPDIFREGWGHTTRDRWTTDDLAVWRTRAAQIRAEFKRDLRLRREYAAKLAALGDGENEA